MSGDFKGTISALCPTCKYFQSCAEKVFNIVACGKHRWAEEREQVLKSEEERKAYNGEQQKGKEDET